MTIETTLIGGAGRQHDNIAAMAGRSALERRFVTGPEWDRIASVFDGICQEQLAVFAEARWPGFAVEPVLFRRGARTVGGCMIMHRRLPLGLGGIAVAKWGPILADGSSPTAGEDYAAMVEALVDIYARQRGMMLTIMPRMSPEPVNRAAARLRELGFRPGIGIAHPARYFVRIEKTDAAQRASYAQKWRYHLNKAEKQGLVFEHCPATDLPLFQALYDSMLDRKRFPDYSAVHTLPALMGTPVAAVRPELFIVRHEGKPVAGAIIFAAGDMAVYLYGATSDKALPLNAGFFMHDRIIAWLRENSRAKWYDLGGTDGFEGLHRFKSGMTGKTGAITDTPPAMNFAARPLPWLVGTGIHRARAAGARLKQAIQRRRAGA